MAATCAEMLTMPSEPVLCAWLKLWALLGSPEQLQDLINELCSSSQPVSIKCASTELLAAVPP